MERSPLAVAARASRKRVLLSGKLLTEDARGLLDVSIRNISEAGALLELGKITSLSGNVQLLMTRDNQILAAKICWIKGTRMGVKFLTKGREARRVN